MAWGFWGLGFLKCMDTFFFFYGGYFWFWGRVWVAGVFLSRGT